MSDFETTNGTNLTNDTNIAESGNEFKCDFCDFSVDYQEYLLQHKKLVHGCDFDINVAETLFENSVELLQSSVNLKEAQKSNTIIKLEQEAECSSIVSEEIFLKKAKVKLDRDFTNREKFCPYCLKSFSKTKARDRENHIKMIHENKTDGKFNCTMCEKSYMSKTAVDYHVDVTHTSQRQEFKCELCDKTFTHDKNVKRHLLTHTSPKEIHVCTFCQSIFLRKDYLKIHIKKFHVFVEYDVDMAEQFKQDSKTYKCKICEEVFIGEEANMELVSHIASKCKKGRRFPCDECTKDFSNKYNLNQHENNVHNQKNQKVSTCIHCDFKTTFKSNLKRHCIKMHKENLS